MTKAETITTETVDRVARTAYGRLVAILAKQTGDIAAAEDALADAFAKALTNWPKQGVPANPQAWLLTVARNRAKDRLSSSAHKTALAGDTLDTMEARSHAAIVDTMDRLDINALRDERLKLMFVCAHEAIDPAIRTPLMLQVVLGLDAHRVATAFAVPASAMAQRLVRAKAKIKQAGIAFDVPGSDELDGRLDCVLEAIYGAFSAQWHDAETQEGLTESLAYEALFLCDLMIELMPQHAECLGLGALLWFSQARATARTDAQGRFVPLAQQDTQNWDRLAMKRARTLLARASALHSLGRFQLEAAISAAHADRAQSGQTNWQAITMLYEGLVTIAPTLGSAVARAAAVGEAYGPSAGLRALDQIDDDAISAFQPAWATRAHLLAQTPQKASALAAYNRAIALTTDVSLRAFLVDQRDTLSS